VVEYKFEVENREIFVQLHGMSKYTGNYVVGIYVFLAGFEHTITSHKEIRAGTSVEID
jgi:hypothetical protein